MGPSDAEVLALLKESFEAVLSEEDALREGVVEFRAALERGELIRL
jgi:hypothetical protein